MIAKIKWLLFHKKWKASTKFCNKCGNTHLLLLRTLRCKICTDCETTIPWELDKNQRPLL